LLRALLAVWHRKCHEISTADMHNLLHQLAEQSPSYQLPPAVHTHTRHYMPQSSAKTSLVNDAWLAINPEEPVYIHWSELTLSNDACGTLETLLSHMSYFGRAESWVDACLTNDSIEANCETNKESIDPETGEILGEPAPVLIPPNATEYNAWIADNRETLAGQFKGKKKLQLLHVMPDTLAEALDRDTADWLQVDKTPPPFSKWQNYIRPQLNIPPIDTTKHRSKRVDIARFALEGKPRLRVRDTIKMAEWFRQATIKKADKHPLLSGHDLPDSNSHQHAFYLPEDRDGDGLLDHMLLYVPGGIDSDGEQALHQLSKLWHYKRPPLDVALLGIGRAEEWALDQASTGGSTGQSRVWKSVTPWYCPWHIKPKRDLLTEVQRYINKECQARKFPLPVVSLLKSQSLSEGSKELPLNRFHFRRKHKSPPPSGQGFLLKLNFEETFTGPLALGYGCHFGLGLFHSVCGSTP